MFQGFGKRILVLNSLQAMNDLFDKRANIYSNRPVSTFGGELMGMDDSLAFLPYGDEWRIHRKLAHSVLSPTAVKEYHAMQEDIVATFAKSMIDTPEDLFTTMRMSAGRIIIAITYGIRASQAQTDYIMAGEHAMRVATKATVPGQYIVDLLPFLKYAPSWVSFQCEAQVGREILLSFARNPLEHVKRDIEAGIALPSFMQHLLSTPVDNGSIDEYRLLWLGTSLFGAGAETTYATVLTFILAMMLNPEKQKLAQAEIDAVVGGSRLPLVQDAPNLRYVDAVIKETMRWQPALHLGMPRRAVEDDYYAGYYIPKGTLLVPNVWAIAYEPNEKYDPEAFLPERHLDASQNVTDPMTWAWGFGRRVCPGRYLAEHSVFIFIATILAVFDILPPEDEDIKLEFTQHLVRSPKPYKYRIVPRSDTKAKLVEDRAAIAVV
ncbi:cytochrome P450 [Obba rivulosa]|uniref:Cytochrome P450 n=1 Tax=Obba rivulosa TaxID=1052685 RepID=A0A8E2ATA8_9APHY|nr:cytochrome P450 [Obba rivulosa]